MASMFPSVLAKSRLSVQSGDVAVTLEPLSRRAPSGSRSRLRGAVGLHRRHAASRVVMTDRVYSEDEVIALARRAYRAGQAAFAVVPNRCALLVIDMQDEFVRAGWTPYWVPEATRMVPRLAAFIARCRDAGLPIIYTAFAATHRGLDRPRSGPNMPNRYSAPDTSATWFREGRIWHELAPHPD